MMYCENPGTPKCLDIASTDDTQLTDLEKNKQDAAAKTLTADFKLKKFNSCDNMENVMKDFIKDYYKAHPYNGYFGGRGGGPLMMEDSVMSKPATGAPSTTSSDSAK